MNEDYEGDYYEPQREQPEPDQNPLEEKPLDVRVENGMLVIDIGIKTLAYALSHADEMMDEIGENYPDVPDPEALAKAIMLELEQENEVGESAINNMLDEACQRVLESRNDLFVYPDNGDDETYEEGTLRTR